MEIIIKEINKAPRQATEAPLCQILLKDSLFVLLYGPSVEGKQNRISISCQSPLNKAHKVF